MRLRFHERALTLRKTLANNTNANCVEVLWWRGMLYVCFVRRVDLGGWYVAACRKAKLARRDPLVGALGSVDSCRGGGVRR